MDARKGTGSGASAGLPQGATEIFPIWPGVPPGSESWDWDELTAQVPDGAPGATWTRNVVRPTLTVFPPTVAANGTAVVIAPGGAFHFLMMDHEGYDLARPLAALG